MKTLVLVKKYTLGLVNAIKNEEEFSRISRELEAFRLLLSEQAELSGVLANPMIPVAKKMVILQEVLARASVAEKTTRFLLLLLEHGRLNLLSDIVRNLPILWHEKKGILTYEVSSVVALSPAEQERLRRELEELEKRPVFLQFKIDPDLVAGLALRKGNVIYDSSIKGHLNRLKERICEG